MKTLHQEELMQNIHEKLLKENFENRLLELSKKYIDKSIILYGAGYFFDTINKFFDLSNLNIIGIADIKFTGESLYSGYKTFTPFQIPEVNPDIVLVTIPEDSIVEKFFQNKIFAEYGKFNYESLYEKTIALKQKNQFNESTLEYINEKMEKVPFYENKYTLFDKVLNEVEIKGLYLEFGVFNGTTINYIAHQKAKEIIHGFDSFEGLPEDWGSIKKGSFLVEKLPTVKSNVSLIKGWFNETLPKFIKENNKPVAFLHIDCDLYSSTKTVFDELTSNICEGTIIFFDEYFNYPDWKNNEYKAFLEFCNKYSVKYKYLGMCTTQVALKILGKNDNSTRR